MPSAGTVVVRDVTDGTSKTLVAKGGFISTMATSSNGRLLATGTDSGVRHFRTACWAHYKYVFHSV